MKYTCARVPHPHPPHVYKRSKLSRLCIFKENSLHMEKSLHIMLLHVSILVNGGVMTALRVFSSKRQAQDATICIMAGGRTNCLVH